MQTYRSVGCGKSGVDLRPGEESVGELTAVTTKAAMSPVARQIARAAASVFARRGYEATSIREIVDLAGVAKPTLYYHFGSKDGLASALLTVPLANLVSTLQQIVTTVEEPIRCIEQVIDAQYAFCREDPDRARFIFALLFGPHDSEIASDLESFRDNLVSWIESAVRRLAEAGIVPRSRIEACAMACRGLVVISNMDFLYRDKPLGSDLARRQVQDLLRGFGSAPSLQGSDGHER
jgi:AcrR family transcriptional regulator